MKLAPDPILPEAGYSTQVVELPLSGAAVSELMRSVLARGVPFRFCARGSSMSPFIRDGDILQVSPLDSKPLRLGDVAAYTQSNGRLVVHRVVRSHGAHTYILGDNTPGEPDGPVAVENILGKITGVQRQGRPVHLGLGPERILIALLSRTGLLLPFIKLLAPLYRFLLKRK